MERISNCWFSVSEPSGALREYERRHGGVRNACTQPAYSRLRRNFKEVSRGCEWSKQAKVQEQMNSLNVCLVLRLKCNCFNHNGLNMKMKKHRRHDTEMFELSEVSVHVIPYFLLLASMYLY